MESRQRNKTKQSLRKTYKFLAGFLAACGFFISANLTTAQVTIQDRGSFVDAMVRFCDINSCSGTGNSPKSLSGSGSINTEASHTFKGASGSAKASLSVVSIGNGVQMTENIAGTGSGVPPHFEIDPNTGFISLNQGVWFDAWSMAEVNTTLLVDFPRSTYITLEIDVQASPRRTGSNSAAHMFMSVGTQLPGFEVFPGSNIRSLYSNKASCSDPCPSTPLIETKKLNLMVEPRQKFLIWARAVGSAGSKDTGTYSGDGVFTVRVIKRELRLEKVSGNNQQGSSNAFLPQRLVVRVTDDSGNPISDVEVRWEITGPPGSIGQLVSPFIRTTGHDGRTQTFVKLGNKPGEYQIKAICEVCTHGTIQTFTATAKTSEKILSKVSGDGQQGSIGITLPKPLVVKVADSQGNPVSGTNVTFEITQQPEGALAASPTTVTKITGNDGKASATLTLGDLPGKYIVKATCPDCSSGSPVTFMATATDEGCTQNGASIASQVGFMSGNLFYTKNLLSLSGTGPQTNLTLAYNSIDNTNSPLGPHWTHNYAMKIERDSEGFITLKEEDGKRIVFIETEADIFLPIDHFGRQGTVLQRLSGGSYQLRRKDGTVYIFDPTGRLSQIQDRNLNSLSLAYNGDDLIQVIDASGRITSLGYDSQGRMIGITDPAGRITALGYSPAGYLSLIKDPSEKSTIFTYDGLGMMLSMTDPDGNEVNYSYDGEGRLISATDASGIPVTVTYQPGSNQAAVTDRDGGQTTYLYDPILDKPLLIIAPDGGMISNTYDQRGNLISTTDPAGNTTNYTYDNKGNLITITDPQGGITSYTYEPLFNQVTSIRDPQGNTTAYTYDQQGNLMSVTDPTGGITSYSYDAQGRLIRLTNPSGQTTTFTYDAKGNLISIIDPAGATTTMTYDEAGNMTSRTDPNGATTIFAYDVLNHLIKTIDPLGNATIFTYDARGNRISQTDAMGRTTQYEYNYQNRLTKVIDPQGGMTSYSYDAKGNLKSIADANGQTTSYTYDTLNRLISETDPLGDTISYSYDKKGNLISRIDAKGQVIGFSYDSLNRLIKKTYPDGGLESFTYDSNGRILSANNQAISYAFAYDQAGRITQATDSRGYTVKYKYDLSGNRVQLTYPDGGSVSYSYDSANRLSSMTDWTGRNTAFSYDNAGRRIGLNMPDNTKTSYNYDQAGRLLDLAHKTGSGSILDSFSYTYDPIGNRLSVTRPEEKINYTYDLLDRLAKATPTKLKEKDKDQDHKTEEFTYDLVGNRITGPENKDTYTYNQGNQLVADRKNQYEYDRNGNLIKKTEVDDDGEEKTWIHEYDFESRLIKVTKQESDEVKTVRFKYDPFGRRIEKKIEEVEAGKTETKTHTYIYDNEDVIVEYLTKTDGNKTKTDITKYVHGQGIDEPLGIERKGEAFYYHADGLGSIAALSDSKQKAVESYSYSSFGDLKLQGDKVKNTYTFTGREWDEEIDLYFYRARYYDAEVGRFISFDPILRGLSHIEVAKCRRSIAKFPLRQPQKLHPFVYADDNPINFVDPKGLACGPGIYGDIIFPDNWFGWYSFESPCAQHDNCYGTCGSLKTKCDDDLLLNMLDVCSTLTPNSYWKNHCEGIAYFYYKGVLDFGQSSYDKSQREACCK